MIDKYDAMVPKNKPGDQIVGIKLRTIGVRVLYSEDPEEKVAYTMASWKQFGNMNDDDLSWEIGDYYKINWKPRYEFLEYLKPNKMPKSGKCGTVENRARVLHTIAHVEL